ncbi:MAG: nucleotidyltransferase domain-containing protein [Chloroflexota bacterium]|nr:nucleotidyltransferase domain-containing protein [Chloroflexota bacterium]MDE2909689.1 nucleotidyltransferase domain-containing protein [Chloroflexota bacterium]
MAEATVRTLEDIRRLRPQIMELARQYRVRQVFVFGSIVRGQMHEDSDIDFLVEFDSDFRLTDVIRLMQGLEKMVGRKVDVVPRQALRKELETFVLSEMQAL